MFQALAAYAVRGPLQAALVASSTLVLSTLLAPLVVVSSAVVALVWMRAGPGAGALAVGLSLLLSTIIASFSALPALAPAGVMISSWLPVIVMAWVLRDTISLNLALLAGAVLVGLIILVVYVVVPDPAASWQALFTRLLDNPNLTPRNLQGLKPEEVQDLLATASKFVTGLYAAILFVLAALSLLLARSWQAHLYNPGGLQKEFHELRYGVSASIAGLAIVLAAVITRLEVFYSLGIVVCAVFSLQGMAIVHALIARRNLTRGWLIGAYVLVLFLLPESLLFLAAMGLTDTWTKYRTRIGNKTRDDGET